jgi:O-methyltransferase
VPLRPFKQLSQVRHDLMVVAADEEKEDILLAAMPYLQGAPKVIVAGYGHLSFRDSLFNEELGQLLVPSFANGYPNTLTHLYQCLVNAARLELRGVVAEFGTFKGGTTMFLSSIIERLGQDWPVFGFDTFAGFPPRRSPLDMYDHPGCIFTDLPAVRRYLEGRNVRVIPGDIVETAQQLEDNDIILSFIDADNYSSARAALQVVQERTVVGGAIVLTTSPAPIASATHLANVLLGEFFLKTIVISICMTPAFSIVSVMHHKGSYMKRPPAPRQGIYELYWYFASERQQAFVRRVAGQD